MKIIKIKITLELKEFCFLLCISCLSFMIIAMFFIVIIIIVRSSRSSSISIHLLSFLVIIIIFCVDDCVLSVGF